MGQRPAVIIPSARGKDSQRPSVSQISTRALSRITTANVPNPTAPGLLLQKSRGATGNPANRFEALATIPFDDDWGTLAADALAPAPLETTLTRDASRTAISWNDSPDIGFDRSLNPYRGCAHGCVYCYARPSHAYLGLSPGLDFETRLTFKPEIAALLERELRKPGYTAAPLVLGANTDAYQPIERTLRLSRAVLEVLDRFNHPVILITKSAGVLRDADILHSMARRDLVLVYLSVTTLDRDLARRLEPRAATPDRRLHAVAELTRLGIPCGVLASPMIPGLNDPELERILAAAAAAGARQARYTLLRLPHELKSIFEDWLRLHVPDRADRVLNLVRQTRGGALNSSEFGQRFNGTGVYADLLAQRFRRVVRQLGLDRRQALATDRFAPPGAKPGREQLSLFGSPDSAPPTEMLLDMGAKRT